MATDRPRNAVEDTEQLATTIGLYVLGEISLGKAPSTSASLAGR